MAFDRNSEIRKELQFHVEERIAALVNSGVPEAEAGASRVRRRGPPGGDLPALAAAGIGIVSMLATGLPSFRASKVDPIMKKSAPQKSDLPQGTLDILLLKAIAQRLQQISNSVIQVPGGSLYPALHRLEQKGIIAAERA